MRQLHSSESSQSEFGTASEFISHGTGESLTEEIRKDYKRQDGSVEGFIYFWEGLFFRLGWQLTREEIMEIAKGDISLVGKTDGDLVKNSKAAFFRVLTRMQNKNDIDLEPGSTIGTERVGQQSHYVVKGGDGQVRGWLPIRSVEKITLVTGIAGVSEPHNRSED